MSSTPADDLAALIRGQLDTEPAPQPTAEPAAPTRRAPKPDRSQASGAYGKAGVDPAGAFGEAINAALNR